ncbi:hypothetical protein [Reichenbachiella sp. MSK19-1]|uniref:hypothetical protein n=1 Tax=Reichenbachiella sp. MSK19-1 TaxID=1897631 RepID=UPI000E6CB43E|nr:hypothetical protein [Reichenbachiella sp. MSK19-1]RJE74798.1 hypothetical protein BGP76_16865 [Reichenbachiella sp. MSK19-1]
MNLKSFVKVGNISNLSDARYCAGFGVDMIGFNLDPQNDNPVALETAQEIMGWVAGVDLVMEYGNLPLAQIRETHQNIGTGYLQVNSVEVAQALATDTKVILKIHIDDANDLTAFTSEADGLPEDIAYLLIDCQDESLYLDIDQAISELELTIPTLKAFDVTADNVLAKPAFYHGIALSGSHEEKPGFKDYDELADILEVLEIED